MKNKKAGINFQLVLIILAALALVVIGFVIISPTARKMLSAIASIPI